MHTPADMPQNKSEKKMKKGLAMSAAMKYSPIMTVRTDNANTEGGRMKATIEQRPTVEVRNVIENAAAMSTMEGAARYLVGMLPGWFVYMGGSHVAVHYRSYSPRVAIITA
jgi:hypothetical protein